MTLSAESSFVSINFFNMQLKPEVVWIRGACIDSLFKPLLVFPESLSAVIWGMLLQHMDSFYVSGQKTRIKFEYTKYICYFSVTWICNNTIRIISIFQIFLLKYYSQYSIPILFPYKVSIRQLLKEMRLLLLESPIISLMAKETHIFSWIQPGRLSVPR